MQWSNCITRKIESQNINWFNKYKEDIEYSIVYQRNTKNGFKGEIKEKGFKIDGVCYKMRIAN